jgi:holo-[acyl-carrier protein] synthase
MLYGIGTDIVAIERLARLFRRHGERALGKILSAEEQAEFLAREAWKPEMRGRFLARRWAAKEAFAKALGTGFRFPVTPENIGVRHDGLGKPFFAFAPALDARLANEGLLAHLSISDEKNCAIAFVILERLPESA